MLKLLFIALGCLGLFWLNTQYPVMATKIPYAIPSTTFFPTYGLIALGIYLLASFSWVSVK